MKNHPCFNIPRFHDLTGESLQEEVLALIESTKRETHRYRQEHPGDYAPSFFDFPDKETWAKALLRWRKRNKIPDLGKLRSPGRPAKK